MSGCTASWPACDGSFRLAFEQERVIVDVVTIKPRTMNVHRFIIGVIFTVIGVIFGLILIRINGRFAAIEVETWQQAAFTLMVAIAALQVAAGYCLIFGRTWFGKLNIFIAAFNLVIFPIGTLAGIYYFWFFLKSNFTLNRQPGRFSH